jgi:hypothetical protein
MPSDANENFLIFDPHADPRIHRDAILRSVIWGSRLIGVFPSSPHSFVA